MNYDPKDASNVIPAGEYEASVKAVATEKTDQQGNTRPMKTRDGVYDMVQVEYEVYVPGGAARKLWVYYAASPKALWRYRQLAQAIGQAEAFKNKQFNIADHIGANLKLSLVVEDNAQYGEQNQIDSHSASGLTTQSQPQAQPATQRKPLPEAKGAMNPDDIPF